MNLVSNFELKTSLFIDFAKIKVDKYNIFSLIQVNLEFKIPNVGENTTRDLC